MILSSKRGRINIKNGAIDNLASIDPVSNLITHELGTLHTAVATEAQICMLHSVFFVWKGAVAIEAIGNDKSAATLRHFINKAVTACKAMGLNVVAVSTDR
jgi:hypothetical protein